MDPTPVGQRLRAWRIVACRREQLALQRRVVELGRDRPSDADHRRPANGFRDRCAADPDRLGDHPGARPTGILQAQNFSNLPHRQSLGGHRTSPCWFAKGGPCPVQIADNGTRFTLSTGWPPSIGIGGRFRSDWVAAFRRNQWPPWLGFRIARRRRWIRAWVLLTCPSVVPVPSVHPRSGRLYGQGNLALRRSWGCRRRRPPRQSLPGDDGG